MQFYDVSSDSLKSLNCTVTGLRDQLIKIPCNLSCDAESTPIETYYGNLTQAKIETSNMYLTVNPDFTNGEDEETLLNSASGSNANNIYYRKNSSGLSGGAIAGIVIACVVVLAAASIAAIMLRKPSPPIDNTTVVGLKTVENM